MELEILGINLGCVLTALGAWKFPESDCLLPLISKLLGYGIVAASTMVKVPQVCDFPPILAPRNLEIFDFCRIDVFYSR